LDFLQIIWRRGTLCMYFLTDPCIYDYVNTDIPLACGHPKTLAPDCPTPSSPIYLFFCPLYIWKKKITDFIAHLKVHQTEMENKISHHYPSSQAKCPILAYSNLPLGRFQCDCNAIYRNEYRAIRCVKFTEKKILPAVSFEPGAFWLLGLLSNQFGHDSSLNFVEF
jgi:hypothetical protein